MSALQQVAQERGRVKSPPSNIQSNASGCDFKGSKREGDTPGYPLPFLAPLSLLAITSLEYVKLFLPGQARLKYWGSTPVIILGKSQGAVKTA